MRKTDSYNKIRFKFCVKNIVNLLKIFATTLFVAWKIINA